MFALYYTALTASDVKFRGNDIIYEFSPVAMKLVKESTYAELPKIDSTFEGEMKDTIGLQMIADENLINGVMRQYQNVDVMYSLKEFML